MNGYGVRPLESSRVVSIKDEDGMEVYSEEDQREPPSQGMLSVIYVGFRQRLNDYGIPTGFFGACGLCMGFGTSMLSKPFPENQSFNTAELSYMLPVGSAFTIIPLLGAIYFYHKTVGEFPTGKGRLAYASAAASAMCVAGVTGYKIRT